MSLEQQQLEAAIAALDAQRPVLGDAVVESLLAPARARLAALAARSEPEQRLKQVSILFLDVVGSTTLSQHLDPEGVSAVIDDALSRGTAIVQGHGGKVLQYAGDNILAAFGVDEAREDDAERAVRCGLGLLALGQELGAEVLARHGHAGFNVRVGVHTGGVLLGGGVDADGSIRGSAVNIAARMEQTAPPGGMRISHDTYAQVRGLFDVDAQEPLAVKGIDAPVQSYLVHSAKPRSFRIGTRGIEGMATRMIGRDAELEVLQMAFKRLFEERKLAAVTVVADAGIGKSRLLYEFEVWSEARPESFFLFRGRATPATGSQAYGLLRELIAWRLQIHDDDTLAAAKQKMEKGLVPLFIDTDGPELAESQAHLLGHLIGIDWKDSPHIQGIVDDPKQIRNRAFHAAAQFIRRVGAQDGSPVVVQLEDLHWADSESLDFLNYLCEVNRDAPLLLLAFTRPTLFERRVDWSSTEGVHTRIDLQPLGKDMSRLLANELLKKLPEIPAALRELLTSSAEGNPFYMEELVKMLIDQGALSMGETWRVDPERLLVTRVPSTLTGVLQARLDGLPAPERRALQQASIVGAVFWDRALAAIEAPAAEHLPALVQRELTLPRADTQLDGLREYAFRHQILHQVTYDTVLRRHRREGHAKVAQWLASLSQEGGPRAGDLLGLAAEHYEQAEEAPNAVEFHTRAAEHARLRMAHDRVLHHVERALALLADAQGEPDAQAELRWRLLCLRDYTLDKQARRDEQAAGLEALSALADELADDQRRAEVARRMAVRAMRMGDWAAQASAARHSMACATRAGDEGLRLNALRLLATAQVSQGDIQDGRALALQGLEEARRQGLRDIEARLLNTLSVVADVQDDQLSALDLDRYGLQIHRETGDRVNEAINLLNLGEGWLKLGDLAQARRELGAALQLLRAHGDRVMEGGALSLLSTLSLWEGDETRALALARQALDIAQASQAREEAMLAALALGDAERALGRRVEALQAYKQAQALAVELDHPAHGDASAGLASVALAEGDIPAALAALQALMADAAAGHTLDGTSHPRLIELTAYQVLSCASDPAANDWLQRAYTALMNQGAAIERHSGAAMRQGYLQHIPHHREIMAAWSRRRV
ncbi:MAG: adenylate/guanylate cyclase domain-containing protein [Aquabacterium sp.]|nr:adenylate/guanylate cyclase domain-containing protein [Aquabacterium sp.]